MAFWKKSEDPWDMEPKRATAATPDRDEEPETLADSLKAWNEARKEEKARKLAESAPEPIPCPWCGKDMEPRYLWGGRGVYLGEKRPGFFTSGMSEDNWDFLDEGSMLTGLYKTVWYCKDCRKLVVDMPPEPKPFGVMMETAPEQTEEQREEEN